MLENKINDDLSVKNPSRKEVQQTPDKDNLKRLFVQSFRHSQGDYGLQSYIFSYLHLLHPTWVIDEPLKKQLFLTASENMAKMFGYDGQKSESNSPMPHANQTKGMDKINQEISHQIEKMQKKFNDNEASAQYVVIGLMIALAEQDLKYLLKGRPNRSQTNSHKDNITFDPYFSYLCHYGFEGHSTGIPEFDKMYTDIVKAIYECANNKVNDTLVPEALQNVYWIIINFYSKHSSPIPTKLNVLLETLSKLE